jgi:glycosyltransferase involved in cell wall biosynthesis
MTDIAFFLVNLDGGGAEKVMLSLVDGLAAKGLKVDLVLAMLEGEYLSFISPNVRVINLSSSRLITSLPSLIKYLKENRPKVLISALEDPNTLAIIAKILARVPTRLVITIHNHLSRYCTESNELKRKLTPFFVRWLFPYADAVVAVSQGVADDTAKMSGLSPKKIEVIYNPIFTPELLNKINEPVNHPWLIDRQMSAILGVGRLTKQKDFPTLIRAFAIVRQQYPVKLMILGQGEEFPNLKALVAELNLIDEVAFLGFVSNPYAYMKQAKMLVMSSIFEGFGNVIVEGMIAGTQVISTDCESGPSEILENGKYGNLVKVGDVRGLASAMLSVLENPLDPIFLQQRGQEFSLETALEKYLQVIELTKQS